MLKLPVKFNIREVTPLHVILNENSFIESLPSAIIPAIKTVSSAFVTLMQQQSKMKRSISVKKMPTEKDSICKDESSLMMPSSNNNTNVPLTTPIALLATLNKEDNDETPSINSHDQLGYRVATGGVSVKSSGSAAGYTGNTAASGGGSVIRRPSINGIGQEPPLVSPHVQQLLEFCLQMPSSAHFVDLFDSKNCVVHNNHRFVQCCVFHIDKL